MMRPAPDVDAVPLTEDERIIMDRLRKLPTYQGLRVVGPQQERRQKREGPQRIRADGKVETGSVCDVCGCWVAYGATMCQRHAAERRWGRR